MKLKYFILYFVVLTLPVFLGVNAWQFTRYMDLEREIHRLEDAQVEWVESNKRLMAGIAVLSSSERIEHIAQKDLGLNRIQPENVLLVTIEGGKEHGF